MNSIARCVLGFLLAAAAGRSAEPWLDRQDLFVAGTGGHALYHIPSVLVTAKGTVIAWCEARNPGGDWGANELVLRRSTDDGQTFGPVLKLPTVPGPLHKNPMALRLKEVRPGAFTYNNAVLIADRDGTVHAVFCLEYQRCFYVRSTDDGVTWTPPTEITAAFDGFRSAYPWKILATGPDHGIQLRSGRLLVPVWLSLGTGSNAHHPSETATIYSDDRGQTWHAGAIAVPDTAEWKNPNETIAAELADGSVMLNVRSESKANRRLVTTSPDGIGPWSRPRFDPALVEPICMASLVRLSLASNGGKNRLLFVNPDNLSKEQGPAEPGDFRDRKNLTVRLSYDEGQTWPVSRVVDPSWSAYSDLAVSPRGTILCFYGSGGGFNRYAGARLTLVRFNLEWLSRGTDSLASGPHPH